ncbi:MAG: S-layer homology domain-containing protein, partial [Anaerovorax sp.]
AVVAKGEVANTQQQIEAGRTSVAAIESTIAGIKNAMGNKQNEINALIKKLDEDTFNKIPALKGQTDVDAAVKAINDELTARAGALTTAETLKDQLETAATKAEAAAEAARLAASPSGISTEGDLKLQLTTGGSIGTTGNALGVTVGGELTVRNGGKNPLQDIILESGGNLTIGNLVAADSVQIHSLGTIKESDSVSGPAIVAVNGVLTSVNGNIGTDKNQPLHVSLDRVTALGKEVHISNDKSLQIDQIVGGDVDIKVDGNMTAGGTGENNNIISDNLDLGATGDIGTSDAALKVDTNVINSNSDNLYVKSDDSISIGAIETKEHTDISVGGNIGNKDANSNIDSGDLDLNAGGSIGEKENGLNTNVPGATDGKADLGTSTIINNYGKDSSGSGGGGGGGSMVLPDITLTDKATGVTVTGQIDGELMVTVVGEHGEDGCILCKIRAELGENAALLAYNITIKGTYSGMLTVEIPVGNAFNGKTLTLLYTENGKVKSKNVLVVDGKVKLNVANLGQFVVLDKEYSVIIHEADALTMMDNKKIPMAANRFIDVRIGDWFFQSVGYMYGLKLMKGVDIKVFNPMGNITRGMLATILYRMSGSEKVAMGDSRVQGGMWYTDGMIWAITQGILKNYEVDQEMTREQFVTMIYRLAVGFGWDLSGNANLTSFTDGAEVSIYAVDAMSWAVGKGLIKGRSENTIAAKSTITRAETTMLLYRLFEQFKPELLVIEE